MKRLISKYQICIILKAPSAPQLITPGPMWAQAPLEHHSPTSPSFAWTRFISRRIWCQNSTRRERNCRLTTWCAIIKICIADPAAGCAVLCYVFHILLCSNNKSLLLRLKYIFSVTGIKNYYLSRRCNKTAVHQRKSAWARAGQNLLLVDKNWHKMPFGYCSWFSCTSKLVSTDLIISIPRTI